MKNILTNLSESRKDLQPSAAPTSARIKLKRAAETIALARQMVETLKDNPEKNKLEEVHSAPPALTKIIQKMKDNRESNIGTFLNENHRRAFNRKLISPLFLGKIDTEEVISALDNNDFDIYDAMTVDGKLLVQKDHYESFSASQYDAVHDRLILKTSVVVSSDNTKVIRTATAVDVIQKLQHDKMRKKNQKLAPVSSSSSSIKSKTKQKPFRIGREIVIPSAHGGKMSLPMDEAEKYFGEDARNKFFDQYRLMCQNAQLIAPNGLNSKYGSESRLGTANPPNIQLSSSRIPPDDQSAISSLAGDQFTFPSSSVHSSASVSSAMQSLREDFFDELQSLSSNRKAKYLLDKEILETQSFGTYNKYDRPNISFDMKSVSSTTSAQSSAATSHTKVTMFSDDLTKRRVRFELSQRAEDVMKSLSELSKPVVASPRTRYLSGCIREGIQPLPNLIIRRTVTTTLDLSHYGMGDKMGRVLAECLKDLPCLESINLNDNNLTDDSLQYLIEAIISIKTVKELDLSRNKIDGQSSDALAEYVSRPDCPLIKLVLQSADVDDGECDRFVQFLCSNEQLLELDMSSNLLGSAESDEGARTGGVALAEFIQSKSCRLQVLKLGWNSIRSNSAVCLTKSLALNNTLTFLDLNNNGIGYEAGELLGDSIMENRTLRTLLVSGNNLTTTACICICIGMVENFALTRVEMNDNPIGEKGVRMIMLISVALGSRVTLQAKNCNIIASDERCWYNPSQPCGLYSLKLDKPFDRAVAFHLLHIVATHNSYIFGSASYEGEKGSSQPLKLIQSIASDRELTFDEDQKKNLAGLRLIVQAASNTQLAHELFFEADADHSGKLDKDELQEVLAEIGFVIEEDRLNDIMAVFDVDGAGTIDLQEFMSLLKSQQREAAMRIKDLIEYPMMTMANDPKKKYIPPKKGVLNLNLIDGFVLKKTFYTISATDQKYAYNMAKDMGDVTMVTEAVKLNKVRFDEAYSMYKYVYKELRDKAGTLIRVLPLITNPSDSRQLVSKVTNDSRIEIARIKLAFGATYRPILGSYNGYYCLDLSKELHRICLQRLLLESQTQAHRRSSASIIATGKVGDTSQHGNWSCFRNEVLNGEKVTLTPALVTPMPQSGILEFDFCTTARPSGGELRLSDKRLCKALQNLSLLSPDRNDYAIRKLAEWKLKTHEKSKDGKLFMPIYSFSVPRALEIGRFNDDFYDHLEERQKLLRSGAKKEVIGLSQLERRDQNNGCGEGGEGGEEDSSTNGGTFKSYVDAPDDSTKIEENENTESDSEEEYEGSSSFKSPEKVLELRQKRIADQQKRLHKLIYSGASKQAKAKRLLEVIEETFNQLWIQARHLALLLFLFRELIGTPMRCKYFGSYCTEIVVALFGRVVDLHNFEVVWEVLDAADCSAVLCRIGILNIFNPMKPELSLELKMDRREERIVAKIIVYLSVEEPGVNLTFKQFMWKRELDPIPGWDVTDPWMTERGMSAHGYFAFTYYSGEGRNKMGCIPDIPLRKALTALVLIDENEIVGEDENMPENLVNTAATHFDRNRDVWINYLLTDKYQ